MLAQAVHAALHAVGRSTVDVGIAATPTTGVLVRHVKAAGGIQISASHNPSPVQRSEALLRRRAA